MSLELLIKSIMGLTALLAVLVVLLYIPSAQKKKKELQKEKKNGEIKRKVQTHYSLEEIREIVKQKPSTLQEIQEALEVVLKYYPHIHPKLGLRPHPESDIYMDILFKAARHPNIDKSVLLHFSNQLEKENESYKKEINDALMRGLNSRGL